VGDDATLKNIEQVIASLDRPKPQVLIKVVFVEVTHRDDIDIGVSGSYRWNVSNKSISTPVTTTTTTGAGAAAVTTTTTANQIGPALATARNVFAQAASGGLYNFLSDDINVTLSALKELGKTEVLSRPYIMARNNQQATITVGQSVPLISGTRFDAVNGQINTITYQDVGIILRVTPFISPEGLVEMIVAPEISSLSDRTVQISGGTNAVGAPVINKRTADTVVVTPSGTTVVIGGLMQKQKTDVDSKVPLLGDIPLLGWAFKHKVKSEVVTELLIFLTPHVVQRPGEVAALTDDEAMKSDLAPKAFSERDLSKYLDGLPMKQPEPAKPAPKAKKSSSSSTMGRRAP
jgi:general secretion pathway protein D